jgi:hypothetical protein
MLSTRFLNIKEVVCKKLRGVPRLGEVLYKFRFKQENETRNTAVRVQEKKSKILLATAIRVGTCTAWIGYCL